MNNGISGLKEATPESMLDRFIAEFSSLRDDLHRVRVSLGETVNTLYSIEEGAMSPQKPEDRLHDRPLGKLSTINAIYKDICETRSALNEIDVHLKKIV
jgi:hypothetical protein